MGEVLILPVVRHESVGLAAQEARGRKVMEGMPPMDCEAVAAERARRKKAGDGEDRAP